MKVVILAGGKGTRLQEETVVKPKPLIEIGSKPIIWHIMKLYSKFGFNEFVICCGHKGYMIKEYFKNFLIHNSDITIDIKKNKIKIHKNNNENWKITLVDTGENTQTGGRILKIKDYVGDTFLLTYGDGLSNIDIRKLISFHKMKKKIATISIVQPLGRFGAVKIENKSDIIKNFSEKIKGDGGWINGGFFVLNKKIFNYIKNENTMWEKEPLENLAKENELVGFRHNDFWHPCDTLRDKQNLESMWNSNSAAWKVW